MTSNPQIVCKDMAEREGFEPFSLHNLKQLHDAGGTDWKQLQPTATVNCLLSDCATADKSKFRQARASHTGGSTHAD